MDDADLVRQVAAEYLARKGRMALQVLMFQEELARDRGDKLSADAWLDIARAAAELSGKSRLTSSKSDSIAAGSPKPGDLSFLNRRPLRHDGD
jgi:hypothetical protein